nr:hypothetical protein CFP56_34128 [Quercus suber]
MDECSEHKTDPLGDSSLHDMMRGLLRMRALQIHCASHEALIKHLKDHLGFEVDALKKFKESSRTLSQESEVLALHEHMEKVKKEVIEEYQVPQPYFNEVGGYYGDDFEDFYKQAVLMFPNLDFSFIQIKLSAPMTFAAKPILNDEETDEEVLVTDTPGGVADDLVNPQEQTDNPLLILRDFSCALFFSCFC